MGACYEIYGCVTLPEQVFLTEEKRLLAPLLIHHPMIRAEEGKVTLCFEHGSEETLLYEGSVYEGLGDILEEELGRLYRAYLGQLLGEVFMIDTAQPQVLKKIILHLRFEVNLY